MLKLADCVKYEELKRFGFKFGSKDKLIYKTKTHGIESSIYIDLMPCKNESDKLKVDCILNSLPDKIIDKLYELITAGIVVKE